MALLTYYLPQSGGVVGVSEQRPETSGTTNGVRRVGAKCYQPNAALVRYTILGLQLNGSSFCKLARGRSECASIMKELVGLCFDNGTK